MLRLQFPQECFAHDGVINGHNRFSPNNRKTKLGKTGHHLNVQIVNLFP